MKYAVILMSLFLLYSVKSKAQNKKVFNNKTFVFYEQSIPLNASVEKYYNTMECTLESNYSGTDLKKINDALKRDFSNSVAVQSNTSQKIIFITNKQAIGSNQSIAEYIKGILVNLNLYKGFKEITIGTVDLK